MFENLRRRWVAWRNRRFPSLPPEEVTPYVVQYAAGVNFCLDTIAIENYRGLLAIESFSGHATDDGYIQTLWRDENAFRRARVQFTADTGLGPPEWERLYIGTQREHKRWWQRWFTLKKIAWFTAGVFLIIGYARDARDASGLLFGRPSVEVIETKTPLDVVVGDEFRFTVEVQNNRRIGNCWIVFKPDPTCESLTNGNDQSNLNVNLRTVQHRNHPTVEPGKSASVEIVGQASKSGTYEIKIAGDAYQGWFDLTKPFDGKVRMLRVWPAKPIHSFRKVSFEDGGRFCLVDCELRVSRAQATGLLGEVIVSLERDIELTQLQFPDATQLLPEILDTPGREYYKWQWQTGELKPFQMIPFTFRFKDLAAIPRKEEQWRSLVADLRLNFKPYVPRPPEKKE